MLTSEAALKLLDENEQSAEGGYVNGLKVDM